MTVTQFKSTRFTSNCYLISAAGYEEVWLVDAGDINPVLSSLNSYQFIKGVFLTHHHYDHIFDINMLVNRFPECVVYTSSHGKDGLFSAKINLSHYHGHPVEFQGGEVQILGEQDTVELYAGEFLSVVETPGHDWSCLSYLTDRHLFTGDSYIPDVEVVTKLRGGDRSANIISLAKIKALMHQGKIICPGHGEMIGHQS